MEAIDILKRVLEKGDLSLDDVKQMAMLASVTLGGTEYAVDSMLPNSNILKAFMMFTHDGELDGDVRLYAFPANAASDVYVRFTLNRAAPTMLKETMNLERFITELSDELVASAMEQGVIEDDDEASSSDESSEDTQNNTTVAPVIPITPSVS